MQECNTSDSGPGGLYIKTDERSEYKSGSVADRALHKPGKLRNAFNYDRDSDENHDVKPQIATSLKASGVNISEQQLAFYDEPIGVSVEHINPIDNMGSGMMSANGNALAGMVTWMATLIATVAIYMTNKKHRVYDIKDSREKINSQLIGGAVSAVTSAFTVTMAVKYIIGFDIPVMETFVYEIFAVFGMMMLILGVMR